MDPRIDVLLLFWHIWLFAMPGKVHNEYLYISLFISVSDRSAGDSSVLTEYYQKSLAIIEHIYGTNHSIFATIVKLFGKASCELGDYNRQKKLLKKVRCCCKADFVLY